MNAPDPTEHFILADGEKKLVYEVDARAKNTGILTLNKEDHTVANLLRTKLLLDDRVIFAGYRMPHPLINHALVRVRAVDSTTPLAVAADAAQRLAQEFSSLERQFDAAIAELDRAADADAAQGDYHAGMHDGYN